MNALIKGRKLYNIIHQVPETVEEKLTQYNLLNTTLQSGSLSQELNFIFQDLSSRENEIFIRYTVEKTTYEDLGSQYSVSRERIRQIYNSSIDKIIKRLEVHENIFLQSVCLIADELGEDLNSENLKHELKKVGLLDSHNQAMFNMCLALIINSKTSGFIDS